MAPNPPTPPTPFEQLQTARTRFDAGRDAVTGGEANDAVVAADSAVAASTSDLNAKRQTAIDVRGLAKDQLVELHAAGQANKDSIDAVLAIHPLP